MKWIVLQLIVLCILISSCQKTEPIENENFDRITIDKFFLEDENLGGGTCIQNTADGGFIITGEGNNRNAFILKLDSDGNQIWLNTDFDDESEREDAMHIIQCIDGSFAVCGRRETNERELKACIWKISPEGDLTWFSIIDPPTDSEQFNGLIELQQGGFICVGRAQNKLNSKDMLVSYFNTSGEEIWTIEVDNFTYDEAYSVVQTSDSTIVIAGDTHDNFLDVRFVIGQVKLDGSIDWIKVKKEFSTNPGLLIEMIKTSDNGLLLASDVDPSSGDVNLGLLKMTLDGDTEWSKRHGINDIFDRGSALVETMDGGFGIAGIIDNDDGNDVYVVQTDSSGELIWSKEYQKVGSHSPWSIVERPNGGFMIVGPSWKEANAVGASQLFVHKINQNGEVE